MDKLPKVDRSPSFVNKELIILNMFGKNITSSTAVDFRYSSNTTEYFYAEACPEPARRNRSDRRSRRDAPGQTYDNLGFFVNEILISLAATGSGVLRLSEAQLTNVASGDPTYVQMITDLLNSQLDNSNIHKPHAYLVWMLYDNQMVLDPASSGVAKVENPNELAVLIREHIGVKKDGYLHAYVSNGSTVGVSFDNVNVTRVKGKIRQINDYYPYGMAIAGLNGDYNEYPIKYTSKELQAGEFPTSMSHGLEMFDFGSRYYDAQLGRWHAPDPAEQFSNPYLAMGNNPVMYVDPDGEFVWFVPVIAGAVIGSYIGGSMAAGEGGMSGANWNPFGGDQGSWQGTDWYKGAIVGGIAGAGFGLGVSAGAAALGANITGASGAAASFSSGSMSLGLKLTSNALISGNMNMLSTALQGGNLDNIYKSGLTGVASGLAAAGTSHFLTKFNEVPFSNPELGSWTRFSEEGISRISHSVGNGLNGFTDRYIRMTDQGLKGWERFGYSMLGMAEGVGSSLHTSIFADSRLGANFEFINAVNTGLTSVPGLGLSLMEAEIFLLSLGTSSNLNDWYYRQTWKYPRNASFLDMGDDLINFLFNQRQ